MHLGTMPSGAATFALDVAGATPLGIRGDASGPQGDPPWLIIQSDRPSQKLADLIGQRVAHTTPSSRLGNLARRALSPGAGRVPDRDHKVCFPGKHQDSVAAVAFGDREAAPIARDIMVRVAERRIVKMQDFRIVRKRGNLPPGVLSTAHALAPPLLRRVRECAFNIRDPSAMPTGSQGADRRCSIDIWKDRQIVRQVAEASGQAYTRAAFDQKKVRAEAGRK